MSVKGKTQQLDVLLGPNYPLRRLYSPNPANARGGGGGRTGAARRSAAATAASRAGRRPPLPLTGAKETVPTAASLPRTDGRHHRFDEPRAQGTLQGTAEHSSRRQVAGKLLAQAERVLNRGHTTCASRRHNTDLEPRLTGRVERAAGILDQQSLHFRIRESCALQSGHEVGEKRGRTGGTGRLPARRRDTSRRRATRGRDPAAPRPSCAGPARGGASDSPG